MCSIIKKKLCAILTGMLLAVLIPAAWADPFRVVKLDGLPEESYVVGINNHQELVGFVYEDDETRPKAFFFSRDGQLTDLARTFVDSGTGLPDELQMVRLNNSGRLFALIRNGGIKVLLPDGTVQKIALPFEPHAEGSVTLGPVNDEGQFLLSCRRASESLEAFYFYQPSLGFRTIHLEQLFPDDQVVAAEFEALTDSGLAYGSVQRGSDYGWQPVEYDPQTGGAAPVLFPGVSANARILAANDRGRFLLQQLEPAKGSPRFVTYDFETGITKAVVPAAGAGSLGVLIGAYREGRLNNSGALTGFTTESEPSFATGLSVDGERVYDVNCSLSPALGLRVVDIAGITDSGTLLVSALTLPQQGAVEPSLGSPFLLVPTGEEMRERYCARTEFHQDQVRVMVYESTLQ